MIQRVRYIIWGIIVTVLLLALEVSAVSYLKTLPFSRIRVVNTTNEHMLYDAPDNDAPDRGYEKGLVFRSIGPNYGMLPDIRKAFTRQYPTLWVPDMSDRQKAIVIREWVWGECMKGLPEREYRMFDYRKSFSLLYGGKGLCDSYATLYLGALRSFDMPARMVHLNTGRERGFRGHYVVEVWMKEFSKWVAVDVFNNAIYLVRGQFASALDLHRAFLDGEEVLYDMYVGGKERVLPEDKLALYEHFQILDRDDLDTFGIPWFGKHLIFVNWVDARSSALGYQEELLRAVVFFAIPLLLLYVWIMLFIFNKARTENDRVFWRLGRTVSIIILIGFCLRLFLAAGLFLYTQGEGFFINEKTYERMGSIMHARWQMGEELPWEIEGAIDFYAPWLANMYGVMGRNPFMPRLLNCIIGAVLIFLCYKIARVISDDHRGAIIAACFMAGMPSLIVWSSVLLKDVLLLAVAMAAVYGGVKLLDVWQWKRLFMTLGLIAILFTMRDYLAFFLGVSLLITLVVRYVVRVQCSRIYWIIGSLVLITVLSITGYCFRGQTHIFCIRLFDSFSTYRERLAIGSTAIYPACDISTPLKALRFLPIGLFYLYFLPFPWAPAAGILQKLIIPEQILWYIILLWAFYALWKGFFRQQKALYGKILILLYIIGVSAAYGLFDGNLGTMYRHKVQIMPYICIFASWGLARFIDKRKDL